MIDTKLKAGIADYVQIYNRRRFYQSRNYRKPIEVYLQSMNKKDPTAG